MAKRAITAHFIYFIDFCNHSSDFGEKIPTAPYNNTNTANTAVIHKK